MPDNKISRNSNNEKYQKEKQDSDVQESKQYDQQVKQPQKAPKTKSPEGT